MVVLVAPGTELILGRIVAPADLRLVDALARMHVAARRLGCRIELRDVGDDLGGLLDFLGLPELAG